MDEEKEFGKYSRQQLRELFAYHHEIRRQEEEVTELSHIHSENIEELLESGPLWSHWYELTYQDFLVVMLSAFGLLEAILDAVKHDDPQQAALDLVEADNDLVDAEYDSFSSEEKGILASLFFALHGNINANRIFSTTMNALISQARSNDEALLNAVLIDRSAVACPSIARRIQLAVVKGDEGFLNKLTKAITRTRPRRPASELDDLRLMLCIIEDSKPLSEYPLKQLHNLLIEDFELGPENCNSDYYDGLKKLINRRTQSRT